MSDVPPQSSPDPFAQCPSGCVCGVRELIAHENDRGPRDADEIDASEMRAMLIAVRTGYETVRSDPRVVERRHAANTAWSGAQRQLTRLRTTIEEKRIDNAAGELDRAERAAQSSRRRPAWLRAVRWPVVAGIGLFDVWYFGAVFRYLTSETGDAERGLNAVRALEVVVGIVPGVVLAIIIAASADALSRPLRAWKAAAPRPLRRDDDTGALTYALRVIGKWVQRAAWWMLPFGFVAFLLFVLARWAGLRAMYPTPPPDGYRPESVMLLIALLTIGAIVVKLLADDPVADELSVLRRRLRLLRWRYKWQSSRTERGIAAYDSAWSDLRTLRDDLVGLLNVKMQSAWEGFILRLRSLHRMAGNVTAAEGASDSREALLQPVFSGIPQPRMELGPLVEVCRLIDERDPADLRKEKRRLDNLFTDQIRGEDRRETALALRADDRA